MQHLPFLFKTRDTDGGLLPLGIVQPRVVPHVELLDGNCLHAEVLERPLGRIEDVARGKDLGERRLGVAGPDAVHRRDLCGDLGAPGADLVFQGLADQLLAMAVAVHQRGIEERDAVVDRLAQRLASVCIVHAAPHVAAESPAAVAELADDVARFAEWSSLHGQCSE